MTANRKARELARRQLEEMIPEDVRRNLDQRQAVKDAVHAAMDGFVVRAAIRRAREGQ